MSVHPPQMTSPLETAVNERDRNTLDMVRDALRRGDGVLAYQPVLSAVDARKVAFYEGLIRVRDRNGRIIPAADFIQETETSEIGRMLDCLALELALKALASTPEIRLSVNMSARSIGYSAWNDILATGLKADPTVGERLLLEITESSAMVMPDVVSAFMDDLQAQGVCFALADFGAGFTSFRYLSDFFFDAVKLDGQFVDGVASSAASQAIVKSLIAVARNFEMFVVAEKVSNEADAIFLIDAGVDCLQGYLLGMPSLREPWLAETGVARG